MTELPFLDKELNPTFFREITDKKTAAQYLKQKPQLFHHLHSSLSSDRELAIIAVKIDPELYFYFNEIFKNDREIALNAITFNGGLLKHAPQEFKNDEEFIINSLRSNGLSFSSIPKSYQNNFEYIFIAINQIKNELENTVAEHDFLVNFESICNSFIIPHLSQHLIDGLKRQNNKDLISYLEKAASHEKLNQELNDINVLAKKKIKI